MNKGSDTFYNHEEIHEENTYLEKKKSFFMGKCFLDYGIKNYTKNTQSFIKHMFAKIFDIDPKNKFKSDLNEISNKFEKNKEKMPAIFKNIQECV